MKSEILEMTDLEMTKLCAEAMGIEYRESTTKYGQPIKLMIPNPYGEGSWTYDPLDADHDAQAMALVKRFGLIVEPYGVPLTKLSVPSKWFVQAWHNKSIQWMGVEDADLNRAIVECVAKMKLQSEVK
jgi:hypothetical protein